MKSFRELKQHLSESLSSDVSELDKLVQNGVLDEQVCAQFNSAMSHIHEGLSSSEERIVRQMVEELTRLISQHLTPESILKTELMKEAVDSNSLALYHQEPPQLVVLRRTAIRQYPFNTKVALYYSDKLQRYFSVPYEDKETPKTYG